MVKVAELGRDLSNKAKADKLRNTIESFLSRVSGMSLISAQNGCSLKAGEK